ncbi:tetratricopeptide repeat protein, partial [Planctomycetota bacterium]
VSMAQSLLRNGDVAQAVERLSELVTELEATEENDRFGLATVLRTLGSIYLQAGNASQAIAFLERSISIWSELAQESVDQELPVERSNLAAAWGSYANALRLAGRMEEAHTAITNAGHLCGEVGHPRAMAVSLAQEAGIYMEQGLFDAAANLFGETLKIAKRIGDRPIEASALQSLGYCASRLKKNDEARKYSKDALDIQIEIGDERGAARTANNMGMADRAEGRMEEARAWFLQSKASAESAGDAMILGHALNNLGILERMVGFKALDRNDTAGEGTIRRAISYLEAAKQIWTDLENDTNLASTLSQLARAYLLLDEYESAENAALECLQIDQLHDNQGEIIADRRLLAKICRAAGKDNEATSWEEGTRPIDTPKSEFSFDEHQIAAIASTALECAKEALGGGNVSAQERALIAEFCNENEPFGSLGKFCVALLRGQLPDVPSGLQEDFRLVLEQVVKQVRLWRKEG